jgi:hypothetical protein
MSPMARAVCLAGLIFGCAGAATVGSAPVPVPSPDGGAAGTDAGSVTTPPNGSSADAASPLDAAPAAPSSDPGGPYTCTLILGTNQTSEWFNAGFEMLVDGAKWELMHAHSAFVELWADPNDKIWSSAIASRCTSNPTNPDRVIFLALSGGPGGGLSMYPVEKWLPLLEADVENIQARYPAVKRIELMSWVRGPHNGTCPGAPEHRTVVYPGQDEAMAMVAAAHPGLVTVAPRWEARSCADFAGNPPHSNPAGAMAWAKMIAQYYGLGK